MNIFSVTSSKQVVIVIITFLCCNFFVVVMLELLISGRLNCPLQLPLFYCAHLFLKISVSSCNFPQYIS